MLYSDALWSADWTRVEPKTQSPPQIHVYKRLFLSLSSYIFSDKCLCDDIKRQLTAQSCSLTSQQVYGRHRLHRRISSAQTLAPNRALTSRTVWLHLLFSGRKRRPVVHLSICQQFKQGCDSYTQNTRVLTAAAN